MAASSHSRRFWHARVFIIAMSFLAICTLFSSFVLFYYYARQIIDNSSATIHKQATIIADETAQMISADLRLAELLGNRDSFREFASSSELPAEKMTRSAYDLSREMTIMVAAHGSYIRTFAACFVDSGYVVTMSRWLEKDQAHLFYDQYPNLTEQVFTSVPEDTNWLVTYGVGEQSSCWAIYRARVQGKTAAYIFIDINLKSFLQDILPDTGKLFIVSNSIVSFSYPTAVSTEQLQSVTVRQADADLELDGQRYITSSALTRLDDVVYAAMDIKELTAITRAQTGGVILTGFIVLACIAILILYTRNRLIRPVENLVQTVGSEARDPGLALAEIAETYMEERSRYIRVAEENEDLQPLALGRQLNHLATVDDSDSKTLQRYARSCLMLAGIQDGDPYLMFAVCCAEDRKGLLLEMNNDPLHNQKGDAFRHLATNALKESFFPQYPGMAALIRKNWLLVLVKGEHTKETMDAAEADIRKLTASFSEKYDIRLVSTHIAWGENTEDFQIVLRKISQEISYLDFWGAEKDIPNAEAEEMDVGLSEYSQRIRRLINRINTEDYDAIPALIDKIVEETLPSGIQNIHISKYRLYTMTALIVTALDEQLRDKRDLAAMLNFEERLYKADSISAFREELRSIFSELLEYRKGQEQLSGNARRMETARNYIDQHYMENSLSISAIAEKLNISSSYLSREFKENIGVNVLEYIQRLRVEAAKPLLMTMSVKEAAEQVGFSDAQGLMRAFKKYEGISPSEYRKIASNVSRKTAGSEE